MFRGPVEWLIAARNFVKRANNFLVAARA